MEARNRLLPEWFNRIATGQIKLPRFQRFEAWSHGEVGDLLVTVLRGLPCGAVLILEVGDKEKFISREMEGTPKSTERVTEHLLDGQQRFTALWRSLQDNYEDRTYFLSTKLDVDEDGAKVYRIESQARWMKNGARFPAWVDKPAKVLERELIPFRLLRPGDIGEEIGDWCDAATEGETQLSRELERLVGLLRSRITSYNIPFLSLPATTPKHVALDVFIKMNTSSVPLDAYDIVVAEVEAASGVSLHDLITQLRHKVPAAEHFADVSNWALGVAAMREDRPPTQASFHQLDLPRMVAEWDRIVEGIKWAVEFLEEERVFDAARLPTVAVLPAIAALYESMPKALDDSGNAKTLLRKYLWRSFLTQRYENSAATRSLQDFRGLRDRLLGQNASAEMPILDESSFPLPTAEELIRAGWPKKKEILARGILAVSLKQGALDIADGALVSRGRLTDREYHHLFPDSLLQDDADLPASSSYRALNCALVTWNTNRNISKKEPLRYLKERTMRCSLGEAEIKSRLASHVVPYQQLNVGGYAEMPTVEDRQKAIRRDYEEFLRARAEMLLDPVQRLCDGRRWPEA